MPSLTLAYFLNYSKISGMLSVTILREYIRKKMCRLNTIDANLTAKNGTSFLILDEFIQIFIDLKGSIGILPSVQAPF